MIYDSKRNNEIRRGIETLFTANNRAITDKTLQAKADMLSESMERLETNKIESFFKYVRERFDTLPTDRQIIGYLFAFISEGTASKGKVIYDLRHGYFDENGFYVPNGTKCRDDEKDWPKGKIQKHRSVWSKSDYHFSGIEVPEYISF